MKLRAEEIVKKYKSRTVVKGVSLELNQGEIVGLLGPNGAGKTTSFYMIVGLIKANGGKIFLDDTDITSFPVYKRAKLGIGYLAQEASVFRQMSVEDNVRSILEMTDFSKEFQREKLESLLDEFGLQRVRKSKGIQLSGGERRRTEIARCLAINPAFILLDEPFAALDEITRTRLGADLLQWWQQQRMSVVFVTHSVFEAAFLSQRVLVMSARPGRIVQSVQLTEPLPREPEFRLTPAYQSVCRELSLALEQAS